MCLEIRITERKVVVAAQARQELKDAAWRQRLFQLAKQENWLGYNASRPGPIWFTFFNQPVTQIPFGGGPDEIAADVVAKTREALQAERFRDMIAKVAAMLPELDHQDRSEA